MDLVQVAVHAPRVREGLFAIGTTENRAGLVVFVLDVVRQRLLGGESEIALGANQVLLGDVGFGDRFVRLEGANFAVGAEHDFVILEDSVDFHHLSKLDTVTMDGTTRDNNKMATGA